MGDRHAFQIGRAGGGEGAVQGGHRGGAVLAVEKFVQGLYAAGHRGVVGGVHVTEQIQHDAFVGVGVEGGLSSWSIWPTLPPPLCITSRGES